MNCIGSVKCKKPKGAFNVFPNITFTGRKSGELSDYLLNKAGVAVLPETSFGSCGEKYLRLSFANFIENIEKALNRMEEALKNL